MRTLLSASLLLGSVVTGILAVPSPAGAVDSQIITITVSDAGFDPAVVQNVNVGDRLVFKLDDRSTTNKHTVTWETNSVCPGTRGGEPCWPDLDFDDGQPNCVFGNVRVPGWRCLIVEEPGVVVRYHDSLDETHGGQISVLGETTTTTGPVTTTTTRPPTTTSTTRPSTTTSTMQTTTTTAPVSIHPLVVSDPGPTTTTTAAQAAINLIPIAPPADKGKDKGKTDDKGKGKVKAAGTESPTTATSAPPALPTDVVFDEASLTPGMTQMPTASAPDDSDEAAIDAAPVVGLLDHVEAPGDDGARLLQLALGAGLCLLLGCGIWGWRNRASRYDPA